MQLRRQGRHATVVVCIHGAECAGCRGYLRELQGAGDTLRDWDGRVLVVLAGPLQAAESYRQQLGLDFAVLADPGERLSALGLAPGTFLIADQWGEIFHVEAGGVEGHPFPAPPEVAEWLRFVTIQCPECQGEAR